MKRIVKSVAVILVLLLASSSAFAQEATQKEDEKKKQEELKKLQEYEVQKQMKVAEQARLERERELDRAMQDYDQIRKRAEEMSKGIPMVVIPDEKVFKYAIPRFDDYYYYGDLVHSGKPGSSWNYSRQVLEASFTNEFTMDAGGDDGNINLSVSGDCGEGSISVAIIMPDGKQLSEVVIDENGSLNWRKSLEEDEAAKWKNGKWIFRIKAKNATGNFRISMNSN